MAGKNNFSVERTNESEKARKRSPDASTNLNIQTQGPESSPGEHLSGFSPENHGERLLNARSEGECASLAFQLQSAYGNAYVQRLLNAKTVQAKMTVRRPEDPSEVEADRVAEMVMNAGNDQVLRQSPEEEEEIQAKSTLQRQTPEEEEEEPLQAKAESQLQRQSEGDDEEVQRQSPEEEEEQLQAKGSGATQEIGESLEKRIKDSRGSGQPLTGSTLQAMEPPFGSDFSEVKVHTDAEANNLARQLNAEAFTTGKHIYFKEGRYQPDSSSGKRLLAHELTHVVQQSPQIQSQSHSRPKLKEDKG